MMHKLERIFLQVDEGTWADDRVHDADIEFVRSELVEQARFSRYGEARRELCEAAGILDAYFKPGSISDLAEKAIEQARAEGERQALITVAGDDIVPGHELTYEDYVRNLADAKDEGAAEERERCAEIAEEWPGNLVAEDIASAIREEVECN